MANPAYGKVYPFEAPAAGQDDQRAYAAEWRRLAGAWGDGIVNDLTAGAAFSLSKSSNSRTITMTLGEFRIRGIHFEPTQTTLSFTPTAPAAGFVRRDRIIARLDPTAKNITFILREGVAVSSGVAAGPSLTRVAGGVWEYSLHTFVGDNSTADQLTYFDDRVFTGPAVYHFGDLLPTPGDFPHGMLLIQNRGSWMERLVRRSDSSGDLAWVSLDRSNWFDVNMGTSLKAGVAPPQYSVSGGRVFFRGEAGPVSGPWSSGPGKGLGQVPVDIAPSFTRVFPIALKNMSNRTYLTGRVYIEPTAQITLDLPEVAGLTVGSVDYSSISYELGA